MSHPCSTARECWPKNRIHENAGMMPSNHADSSSPARAENDSDFPTCGNHVDSNSSTFRWSEWSPRVVRFNAPRENGAKLIEPPLSLAGEIMAANRHAVVSAHYDVQGRSLAQLACEARKQLLAAAARYTRSYRDVVFPENPAAVVIAGHQPEMFHPGVWFKNFALARLARDHQAVAVNLQIDSDVMKSAAVRVPGGSVEQPRMENISFDRAAAELPFEQRAIIDRACFESFAHRAGHHLQSLIPQPLLARFWPLAVERSRQTNHVGAAFSQARHQIESSWGLQTLEIPQSQVCDLPAMRWFMAHLLAHLPRLWDTYNSALLEYRREHKVRSAAHPVPELDSVDGWLEAPLWIWTESDPRRRSLFVRQQNDELVLSDREGTEAILPLSPEDDAAAAVERWAVLSEQGIRLRTRALITTMAARLLLGDLFVHGIGGAKYDQLTDRIIERFFGVSPPGYLVISGTLRLPLPRPTEHTEIDEQIRQRIRELAFHPERFLDQRSADSTSADHSLTDWAAEKRRWLATEQTTANARQRCRAIRQANEALQPAVANLRDLWTSQAIRQAERERSEALLLSREYAFTLFPELDLTKFLLPILENSGENG